MQNFQNIKVTKRWGSEHEVFNNGEVACWYLSLKRGESTSLHMHEKKETSVILLNGTATAQAGLGLSSSRTIEGMEKTRFSAGFFHRHSAITDCDLLEIETPIDKLDLYRFKDEYGREGTPYESYDAFSRIGPDDPVFDKFGIMRVGMTTLRLVEFVNGAAFAKWARKIPSWSIVVNLRGSLMSPHGVAVVKPGHANWSQNLASLLDETKPDDNIQVIFINRQA